MKPNMKPNNFMFGKKYDNEILPVRSIRMVQEEVRFYWQAKGNSCISLEVRSLYWMHTIYAFEQQRYRTDYTADVFWKH